jgi:arylsulfatase A-like enzyme
MLNSDHGEGFGEHGYTYHGQHLFNDQVHVPLALVGPGLPSKAVATPVAMLDVLPTVMQLAGQPVPLDARGVSLLPYADDNPPPRGPIFTEMLQDKTHPQNRWAVLDWPWKLHYGARFNEYLLFDLSTDPTEQKDLSETRTAEFERMQALLRRWLGEELKPEQPHW